MHNTEIFLLVCVICNGVSVPVPTRPEPCYDRTAIRKEMFVNEFSDLVVNCSCDKPISKKVEFTITRNDTLRLLPERPSAHNGSTLRIQNVTIGDGDDYICRANMGNSSKDKRIIKISVRSAPIIISLDMTVVYFPTPSVDFKCLIYAFNDSSDPLHVSLINDGEKLQNKWTLEQNESNKSLYTATLTVDCCVPQCTQYTVRAWNKHGEANSTHASSSKTIRPKLCYRALKKR